MLPVSIRCKSFVQSWVKSEEAVAPLAYQNTKELFYQQTLSNPSVYQPDVITERLISSCLIVGRARYEVLYVYKHRYVYWCVCHKG
jgi:hypothetical protein